MATHSSILAWKIPWTEESGRRQSMGLQRVQHDLVTNTSKLLQATGLELDLENKMYTTVQVSNSVDGVKNMSF